MPCFPLTCSLLHVPSFLPFSNLHVIGPCNIRSFVIHSQYIISIAQVIMLYVLDTYVFVVVLLLKSNMSGVYMLYFCCGNLSCVLVSCHLLVGTSCIVCDGNKPYALVKGNVFCDVSHNVTCFIFIDGS